MRGLITFQDSEVFLFRLTCTAYTWVCAG
uniref:Uncharacterized protein n=1 Tax=Anguilla anguilla TaxID=7936 RepID=A0A0E9SHD3_ANGAN